MKFILSRIAMIAAGTGGLALIRSAPATIWEEHGPRPSSLKGFGVLLCMGCLRSIIVPTGQLLVRLTGWPAPRSAPRSNLPSDHPLWDRPLDG